MPRPRTVQPRSLRHAALGQAIESFMHERKLTPNELAQECGLAVEQLGTFTRGRGNPTYSTLLKICDGLRIGVTELHARADTLLTERLDGNASGIDTRSHQPNDGTPA
jgi:transcriptional regulator with XRE-family HTH domain